jgi:uncharacterized membrane protein
MNFILTLIHTITQVHPPHPMFVHFPIGLTGAALFFILLALWKRSDLLEKVAFANLSLSTLSVIVAASFGIRDNLVNFGGTAPNHFIKIILATTLFIVSMVTVLVRWKNPDLFHAKRGKGSYVAAYFACFGIAMVLGFLGGVIMYGFR